MIQDAKVAVVVAQAGAISGVSEWFDLIPDDIGKLAVLLSIILTIILIVVQVLTAINRHLINKKTILETENLELEKLEREAAQANE